MFSYIILNFFFGILKGIAIILFQFFNATDVLSITESAISRMIYLYYTQNGLHIHM